MAWVGPAIGAGGSLLGGVLGGKGAKQAAQTASDAQTQIANQEFDKAIAYQSRQQDALRGAIGGLGPNPFLSALSQLRPPMAQNTYKQVGGNANVPQFGGGGQAPQFGMAAPPAQGMHPPPPSLPTPPPMAPGPGAPPPPGPPRMTDGGGTEMRSANNPAISGALPSPSPGPAPAGGGLGGGMGAGNWNLVNALRAAHNGRPPITTQPHMAMDR